MPTHRRTESKVHQPLVQPQLLNKVEFRLKRKARSLLSSKRSRTAPLPLVEEPVLREFAQDEIRKIVGLLAATGACRGLFTEVGNRVFLIANVIFETTRRTYRELYRELLPHDDLGVRKPRQRKASACDGGTDSGPSA